MDDEPELQSPGNLRRFVWRLKHPSGNFEFWFTRCARRKSLRKRWVRSDSKPRVTRGALVLLVEPGVMIASPRH